MLLGVDTSHDDIGYWLSPDRDARLVPVERNCAYCNLVHPIELFLSYPCCGYKICRGCFKDHSKFCAECLTALPSFSNPQPAIVWLGTRRDAVVSLDPDCRMHLMGRIFVKGTGTYLDELIRLPLYERLEPPCAMLALMNPTSVSQGVKYLEAAANKSVIAAMLDLADVYVTDFPNDPFPKDKKKAEYWFRRALGHGNSVFPLSFTRYGLFLKWEARFDEAKTMFQVAAEMGHARGQFEFAQLLLQGSATMTMAGEEDNIAAVKWLCKASEKGFYIPSYLLLAKTLTEASEKVYGTAKHLGKSPLPRVLQMLELVKDRGYGFSQGVETEATKLLERYDCKSQCLNCGASGSEKLPLVSCAGCGVVMYCSKICQKRSFRDGHKYDCCSRETVFDFQLLKTTLPWIKNTGQDKEQLAMPSLQTKGRTLMDMVEDDTDEVNGENDVEYDEHLLAWLILRMRKNLEAFLIQIKTGPEYNGRASLKERIDVFAKSDKDGTHDFVLAMHKIREYGNRAAHASPDALDFKECEAAVESYRRCKEAYDRVRLPG